MLTPKPYHRKSPGQLHVRLVYTRPSGDAVSSTESRQVRRIFTITFEILFQRSKKVIAAALRIRLVGTDQRLSLFKSFIASEIVDSWAFGKLRLSMGALAKLHLKLCIVRFCMNSALVNVDGREVFVTLSGELIVITLRLLDTNSHYLVVVACEERVCLDLHSYLVALRCQRSLGIICLLLFGEALDRVRFSIE